jgi:hypothetical protein
MATLPTRNVRRNPSRYQAFFLFTLTRHHDLGCGCSASAPPQKSSGAESSGLGGALARLNLERRCVDFQEPRAKLARLRRLLFDR